MKFLELIVQIVFYTNTKTQSYNFKNNYKKMTK